MSKKLTAYWYFLECYIAYKTIESHFCVKCKLNNIHGDNRINNKDKRCQYS